MENLDKEQRILAKAAAMLPKINQIENRKEQASKLKFFFTTCTIQINTKNRHVGKKKYE